MVWPFLAMILYRQFNMSATGIGGLLALSSILGSVTGIYTGYLSDIFCRRTVMLIGVMISIISFIMMSFSSSPILYLIAISGISIGRALLEACSKALIGDYIDSPKERVNTILSILFDQCWRCDWSLYWISFWPIGTEGNFSNYSYCLFCLWYYVACLFIICKKRRENKKSQQ